MESDTFNIRSLLELLRRQIRLILLTLVAGLALSAVVIFSLTPTYTASTLVLVDPSRKNLLEPEVQVASSTTDSARIDSEVEILRSDNVLMRVVASQNLVQDDEFGVSLSWRAQLMAMLRLAEPTLPTGSEALNIALGKLQNAISVQRRGGTYLISISVRSQTAEKAADLANAVADAYIREQVAAKVEATNASLDVLRQIVSDARAAVTNSEGSFDNFISANIESIARESGRSDLANIQLQIQELEQRRSESNRLAQAVATSVRNSDLQSITTQLQTESIAALDREREELAQRLAGTAADTPAAIDLRAQLADIEQRLLREAADEVARLQGEVRQSETQGQTLRQDLRNSVLSTTLPAGTLTELYELQQNAELARSQLQQALTRSQELTAQANAQVADSRIVSQATVPGRPSFPNVPQLFTVALVAFGGLGVGLAFIYENLLGGFVSQSQLEAVVRRRVASTVPRVKAKANDEGSLPDQMVNAPLSIFAESVRQIRAAVDLELRHQPPADTKDGSIIMVTSTAPEEGKTTIAISLARSYALSGRKTLLIDCDLRKPSVHKQLKVEPSFGLLDFLSSNAETVTLDSILVEDQHTSATVLLGARRSGLPTDQLISGAAFNRLISAAQRAFDIVVIDTPPVGAVVDGLYIAPTADVVVHVVRWSSTVQSDVRDAIELVESATKPDVPVLAVLNQADEHRSEYKSKYGHYYAE